MQITDRDNKILEFLDISPSTSKLLAEYLSASKQVIQRRLQKMYENEKVKRYRVDINSHYIYYLAGKRPKDLNHILALSQLYVYWTRQGYTICKFKREVKLYQCIRSDGLAIFKKDGVLKVVIIEVDISTVPRQKIVKYENYKANKGYIAISNEMPTVG